MEKKMLEVVDCAFVHHKEQTRYHQNEITEESEFVYWRRIFTGKH